MEKIPTVFVRDPDDMSQVLDEWHPDCLWVRDGEGVATRKYDGTCVLIRRDGLAVHAWARREVKAGKPSPAGFVAVATDEATGKTVGWEPAAQSPFAKFIDEAITGTEVPGTYELVGPKVQGNPEGYEQHTLVLHETAEVSPDDHVRDFTSIRALVLTLAERGWEGIVWHHPDGRMAKIKARDYRAPRRA